jgi:aspartyl-tRNA(Asn)/glutamyl-tRNA(Gln) amidotransferase subunit A
MGARPATLREAAGAIAAGTVSSVELVADCLARARRENPRLHCFLRLDDDDALAAARAADAARATGRPLGALHGVPIALKDMFYDPPRPTSGGSAFLAGHRGARTATVVERLRAAGAINLGALNMTEFALGPTGHNQTHGDCRNPWDPSRIAGGSSSGAGAAVAARLAYGAVGSDTGGSVRGPASVNGVLGLKPTYGLVPRTGAMPLSWSCDHVGPLARTAGDLACLLGAIAGPDPGDPTTRREAPPDYLAGLAGGIRGLRIGIPRRYYFEDVAADVGAALEAALAVLAAAGAELVPVDAPDPATATELGRVLVYAEAAAAHAGFMQSRPEAYSGQVRARIATGYAIPAPTYLAALQLRTRYLGEFVAAVFGACEAMLTPTLAIAVPTLAATDVGGGESMWAVIASLVRCVAPFNYLGVPALSVPAGFDAAGMPVGMQLVGPPFAERRLLRVAEAYQRATDWHERVPPAA